MGHETDNKEFSAIFPHSITRDEHLPDIPSMSHFKQLQNHSPCDPLANRSHKQFFVEALLINTKRQLFH